MADFPDTPSAPDPRPPPPVCIRQFVPGDGCYLCVGSDCNLWVPETKTATGHSIGLREVNEKDTVPTGRGVCADNLRAFPWDDPAGVERG